jgi:hypothetical protein
VGKLSTSQRIRRGLVLPIAALVGAAAVVVGTTAARASVLFSDDFEQPSTNVWQTGGGGTWAFATEDGSRVFRQFNEAVDTAAWAGSGAGAFTVVTATVKPTSANGTVALLSKVANPNNFYYAALRGGQLVVGRRSFGTVSSLASVPFAASTGVWYRLTLNLFFTGQIQGSVAPVAGGAGANVSAADPGGTNFGGAVGFWTVNASASFDNIRLSDDRVTPPTTTPPPTAACPVSVLYTVPTQWPGYIQGALAIRNLTSTSILAGWRLTFSFTNGETIQNLFNAASWNQIGPQVSVTGPIWGPIAPSGSFNALGFIARAPNGPGPITDATFNGARC